MNKFSKIKIIFFFAIFLSGFLLWQKAEAATYWISPIGAAADLAACSGETPLSGSIACSYDKANSSGVVAGDTVYYRAGSYSVSPGEAAINPYNTGTAGNIITFSAYNNEVVTFAGSDDAHWPDSDAESYKTVAVDLDSEYGTVRSYIKITGINFYNFMQHMWIRKGGHNEISYCKFMGYPANATENDFTNTSYCGTYIYRQAQYNWIHNNTFAKFGYNAVYGDDIAGPFCMGLESSATDYTMYNLVENNEMYAGGHHVGYINGSYNIYRNNYFHNEPWYPFGSPVFATRILAQEGYGEVDGIYNLNEGNRIGYGGPKNKDEVGGLTTQVKGAYNIWRYNTWVQSYLAAILLENYAGGQTTTHYNKIYNNTFWHGGYGLYQDYYAAQAGDPAAIAPTNNWAKSYHHPINISDSELTLNNTIKNNLFYQNNTSGAYTLGSNYDFVTYALDSYSDAGLLRQNISNNWIDSAGDPKFSDISGTPDPTNGAQWDFNLQSSSSAINAGTYLMTVSSVIDSDTFVVPTGDASYFFYDKGDFATAFPTANVNNDYICLTSGTTANTDHCVQISSIDYDNNTINTASAHGASTGWYVWLYKKSDGEIVLSGSAPDYGAYEYISETSDIIAPAAPTNLAVQ